MTAEEFSRLLKEKAQEIDTLFRRKLPVLVGRMAKDHFQDNFRRGGFVNGGLHEWPVTKRQRNGGSSADAAYGPLLSRRNHLFNSLKYVPGNYQVTVSNDLQYAPIHNWGGTVSPNVTPRMRRFAWAMYYAAQGKKKDATRAKRKPKNKVSSTALESPQALLWKRLALTKKKKLAIRIPQRQFLGESEELTQKINTKVENELTQILKL